MTAIKNELSPSEFRDLYQTLVRHVEEDLASSWWRRVREATKQGEETVLLLLKAEAENRLDHARRSVGLVILRVLFRALGLNL